ncbi:2-hydroxychromene-2-carboxylate isomerase [Mesorhizobium sp. 113-3-9]|uniref:2-hydroxychromene-2-carboxylate isomerase n=1 Tax=Mesorhizobium sp. 113-3-9 TaxID=2744517 RepID=UPI0019295BAC|nr:2-hydroxychromene-2-carboxylate isomerase [Mesorhizobium sp. 113-3-9]BCG90168.1 2-hydroxychromene-2-carboxylate isomerase [Mesorhizobium sp. 113-3-9]
MAGPIRFYFDFASPYAYFAAAEINRIGEEFGRPVEWRPILVWAVLKALGIQAPMDPPAKRDYFLKDMRRSAAFHGLPYRHPVKLPLSSHLAARLFHGCFDRLAQDLVDVLARRLLNAFFVEHQDISGEATLVALASETGISEAEALEAMHGQLGRTRLEAAVREAIDAGVVGSPYVLVDGEGFFGADRLPQLRWFLAGGGG